MNLRELLERATVGSSPPPLPASGTYTAEQVAAFESEHGHDIRLDCYPEYGCLVQSAAANAIFDAAPYLLDVADAAQQFLDVEVGWNGDQPYYQWEGVPAVSIRAIRDALTALAEHLEKP